MKININAQLKDIEGNPIYDNGGPATIGRMASNALRSSPSDDSERKIKLAKKIIFCEEDELELPAEDVGFIKRVVSNPVSQYSAEAVEQFKELIDPIEEEDDDSFTGKAKKTGKDKKGKKSEKDSPTADQEDEKK